MSTGRREPPVQKEAAKPEPRVTRSMSRQKQRKQQQGVELLLAGNNIMAGGEAHDGSASPAAAAAPTPQQPALPAAKPADPTSGISIRSHVSATPEQPAAQKAQAPPYSANADAAAVPQSHLPAHTAARLFWPFAHFDSQVTSLPGTQ
jgi:hypothetical protein